MVSETVELKFVVFGGKLALFMNFGRIVVFGAETTSEFVFEC